jgi:hypothetical protein
MVEKNSLAKDFMIKAIRGFFVPLSELRDEVDLFELLELQPSRTRQAKNGQSVRSMSISLLVASN